jgi:formate/nitrite transporter FocA (FNT family)
MIKKTLLVEPRRRARSRSGPKKTGRGAPGDRRLSSFAIAPVGAVFAGWLIRLMIWLLPAAESARVSTLVIIAYLVGTGGFDQIVAGSTTMFFLVVTHSITWKPRSYDFSCQSCWVT